MKEGEKHLLKREAIIAELNMTTGTCILVVSYIPNTTIWYENVFILFAVLIGFVSIVTGLIGYFDRYKTTKRLINDLCTETQDESN